MYWYMQLVYAYYEGRLNSDSCHATGEHSFTQFSRSGQLFSPGEITVEVTLYSPF